jgi:meso-butanediol dehydrogenase / (S,S)-butanediol dehydrogenase / diacetyl reductase
MPQLLRHDSVAFITGAGSGIGQAIAYAFARHGVRRFALCDISPPALARTLSEIQSHVPLDEKLMVESIIMDVSRERDVADAVERTVRTFGSIDIAVNNAGVAGPLKGTAEYSVQEWDRVLGVNLNVSF